MAVLHHKNFSTHQNLSRRYFEHGYDREKLLAALASSAEEGKKILAERKEQRLKEEEKRKKEELRALIEEQNNEEAMRLQQEQVEQEIAANHSTPKETLQNTINQQKKKRISDDTTDLLREAHRLARLENRDDEDSFADEILREHILARNEGIMPEEELAKSDPRMAEDIRLLQEIEERMKKREEIKRMGKTIQLAGQTFYDKQVVTYTDTKGREQLYWIHIDDDAGKRAVEGNIVLQGNVYNPRTKKNQLVTFAVSEKAVREGRLHPVDEINLGKYPRVEQNTDSDSLAA